ncbi:MAG: hypothetical protein KGH93_03300 [Patescibacteria group bacterium]|nr:hypothetical protein [Patescibacteria group bacterium]
MQAIEKLDNIDLIAPMMNALEAGNDFVFEQEYRKLMSVNPESFSKLVDFARVQNAAILEALLVPCEGSPSVRDTYNFAATEEEVEKLVNFFKRNAAPKTNAARGKTGTGKGSARKRASR